MRSAAPAPAPSTRSGGPAEAVQRFYAAIDGKRFSEAYDLFTSDRRSKVNFESWVKGYDTTVYASLGDVQVTNQSSSEATVTFQLSSEDREGTRTIKKKFQGTWKLVNVHGAWKLDTPSMRQVA